MSPLAFNLSGKVKRVMKGGRSYLVAPVSTIVPGVLPGSKGPLYYPADEVSANPGIWNGTPVVVYHPFDPVTNEPLSAADPGVLDRQGIGYLANDRFANGKRVAVAYIDEAKARQVDPRVLDNLERGIETEVSTGLYTDNDEAPLNASCPKTGRAYTHVARNYKPDHLAILPDQKGACSLADGCGLLVNKGRSLVVNCGCGGKCGRCGFVQNDWVTLESGQHVYASGGDIHPSGPSKGEDKSESKPAEAKPAEKAGPWHGSREEVFQAMRRLGDMNDNHWKQAQKLGPRAGYTSIGSSDFDHVLKASVGDQYLRSIRQGATPTEAHAAAAKEGAAVVKQWNEKGSKTRVSITGPHELKRWEGAGTAAADHVHAMFKANLPASVKNSLGGWQTLEANAMPPSPASSSSALSAVAKRGLFENLTSSGAPKNESKMVCDNCGAMNDADANYCKGCGEKMMAYNALQPRHTSGRWLPIHPTLRAAGDGYADTRSPTVFFGLANEQGDGGLDTDTDEQEPDEDDRKPLKKVGYNAASDEIDPDKACEIMRDGEVHGHELTEAQRGMFGAACGKATKNAWTGLGNRFISQKARDKMPDRDFAGPGTSFPIRTQADVEAAARLIGKATNPEAVKRRIIAIARRKGLKIPDAWKEEQTANAEWSALTTTDAYQGDPHVTDDTTPTKGD